jgi:selenide,water dikinase
MTDVTGFGLLGHLVEICKGSGVTALLDYAALPILPNALDYAARGCVTGASARNWTGYGKSVVFDTKRFGDAERALLTDPQTSGGLLVACAPDAVTQVLAIFLQQGFAQAAVIGDIVAGEALVKFAKEARKKEG